MTQVNNANGSSNTTSGAASAVAMVVDNNDVDQFGRDGAERLVELQPGDAESVDKEVTAGDHDSYDDALHYIIVRGLAEIKRQRDAQQAARAKTALKAKADTWKALLELNPSLIADPNVMSRMLSELGIAKQVK